MNITIRTFALVSLVILLGCQRQSPDASSYSSMQPGSSRADSTTETVFDQKVACFQASRAFVYNAMSPRDSVYRMTRTCYVPTLNTCVVEYVASPDGSAMVFDTLTGETLASFLNYPGDADKIIVSERLSGFRPESTATTPDEGMTKELHEYKQLATRLFASCAK